MEVSTEQLRKWIESGRAAGTTSVSATMDSDDDDGPPNIFLVDVRNPDETAQGMIPCAKAIPLPELQDALALPNTQFQLMYNFEKPSRERSEVVFYCRSGVRSQKACEVAHAAGFKRVRNYRGSWLAWVAEQENLGKQLEQMAAEQGKGV
ncbi:hypothetical protein RI367_007913 [Sorochytrium milnesiophthora]